MDPLSFDSSGEIRSLVDDLFRVRPGLYWLDFALCMVVAWGSFYAALQMPWHAWVWKFAWTAVCISAFFRGLVFTHEMAHIPQRGLPGFRWVWNALCGMFFFLPDYTYLAHAAHHRVASFSTRDDPEYLPLAGQRWTEILLPIIIFPFIPFFLAIRFLILGPISLLTRGRFREWLLVNASTLKMNPRFIWKNISAEERRQSIIQDVLCIVWWVLFLAFCYWKGEWAFLVQWYLVSCGIFTINHFRSLARHRYLNAAGNSVSYVEQLLDSVTITGFSPLAVVFMPVGLRYHSVHHMFPTLPYYALRQAHRRLSAALPTDHLYFKTLVPTMSRALVNFFRTAHAIQPSAE